MKRFEGKVVLVTASTLGIGKAIAERFGQEGAAVVVSSRKQKNVDEVVQEFKGKGYETLGLVCHAGKMDHLQNLVDKTVAKYGKIDVLVSNVAVNPAMGPIMNATEAQYDKIFDVNVKSHFFLMKMVHPHMPKKAGSSVIFVSSVGGFNPSEALGLYSVSKTALIGMIKALRYQLAKDGIRINGLAPGVFKTRFAETLWKDPNSAITKMNLMTIPLGKFGEPEECGGVAAFLASDDASHITGETIVVNGGNHARL